MTRMILIPVEAQNIVPLLNIFAFFVCYSYICTQTNIKEYSDESI